MQVNDDIQGNNWNIYIIYIDMTVIELRHNSYIGQKKSFGGVQEGGCLNLFQESQYYPILTNWCRTSQPSTAMEAMAQLDDWCPQPLK